MAVVGLISLSEPEVCPRAGRNSGGRLDNSLRFVSIEVHRVGKKEVPPKDTESVEVDDRANTTSVEITRGVSPMRRDVHCHPCPAQSRQV
jgi:hypothetical protein